MLRTAGSPGNDTRAPRNNIPPTNSHATAPRGRRPQGALAQGIASSAWFKNGTPEQRRMLAQAVMGAKTKAANRKESVKAHPDLADRLCASLGYLRFDQWNGYVPPKWMPGARYEDVILNDSPIRAELIAILNEVAQREATS